MLTVIIILIVVVAVVMWVIGAYNRMVQAKNLVEESWNQIDVELNRRYDLIPNLVATIKGAAGHEKSTLESVIGLRNQAAALAGAKASPAERAAVEEQLTSQLQNLISVTVEAYPDLKANTNFLQLQTELSEIESRIANSRKYYNANVGSYNTLIESFPNSLIAGGRFTKAQYFQIQDPGIRQAPTVDFGTAPAGAPAALSPEASGPFAATPAPAGDYTQPDFNQTSGIADETR